MSREMVPYVSSDEFLPVVDTVPLGPGQYQAVHLTVLAEWLSWYLGQIEEWFAGRDEVILVGSGLSVQGKGFIVLEWEECEVDPLFLEKLEDEDAVVDVCVYIRSEDIE